MKQNFRQVHEWVLVHEGGFVDHPADPGGATNQGITQHTYDGWRRAQGEAIRSVKNLLPRERDAIYKTQYWNAIRGDDLPSGLDYAVYDFAVHSGSSRAAKTLQKLLGVKADGHIGNVTLGAIATEDPVQLISRLCEERLRFMQRLAHWPTFKRGWTRRIVGDRTGVQNDDIGVIDRATALARGVVDIPAPLLRPHAIASKAEGSLGALTVFRDITGNLGAVGGAGAASALSLVNGNGPVQWAVAGAIFVAVMVGTWLVYKRFADV